MDCSEILKVAKPILFNTDMVRAILDGRKTVTRRVVKGANDAMYPGKCSFGVGMFDKRTGERVIKPPYEPGDILYVRETWWRNYYHQYGKYFYRADGEEVQIPVITGGTDLHGKADGLKWRPSIHMPKEAARLFLRVTGVHAERLQEIPHDGALKEGIHYCGCPEGFTWKSETDMNNCYLSPMGAMEALWNSTIPKKDLSLYGWDVNPWVWVINFEKLLVS